MYIHVYGEAIVEPKLVDMPTQNPKSEARIPKQIQTAKSQGRTFGKLIVRVDG